MKDSTLYKKNLFRNIVVLSKNCDLAASIHESLPNDYFSLIPLRPEELQDNNVLFAKEKQIIIPLLIPWIIIGDIDSFPSELTFLIQKYPIMILWYKKKPLYAPLHIQYFSIWKNIIDHILKIIEKEWETMRLSPGIGVVFNNGIYSNNFYLQALFSQYPNPWNALPKERFKEALKILSKQHIEYTPFYHNNLLYFNKIIKLETNKT